MTTTAVPHDAFHRLAQAGQRCGIQLVRIAALSGGNRYTAHPLAYSGADSPQPVAGKTLTVTNLAEPADQPGEVSADTDAVAIDVEGRWIVYVRPAVASAAFPAKVVQAQGGAGYLIREQTPAAGGAFGDKPGAADVAARNLAELSLGPGAAVAVGAIVIATAVHDGGTPPAVSYIFDHPAYAKYLD